MEFGKYWILELIKPRCYYQFVIHEEVYVLTHLVDVANTAFAVFHQSGDALLPSFKGPDVDVIRFFQKICIAYIAYIAYIARIACIALV